MIASLNGMTILSMPDLREAIRELKDGKPAVLQIERHGRFIYIEWDVERQSPASLRIKLENAFRRLNRAEAGSNQATELISMINNHAEIGDQVGTGNGEPIAEHDRGVAPADMAAPRDALTAPSWAIDTARAETRQ